MKSGIWNNPPVGFRMMKHDPFAFIACGLFVAWQWPTIGEWALIAPFVLCNFFLFCNVFRLRRNTELVWSVLFLINAVAWLKYSPSLLAICLTQLPVTVAAIAYTAGAPGYRGVFAASGEARSA